MAVINKKSRRFRVVHVPYELSQGQLELTIKTMIQIALPDGATCTDTIDRPHLQMVSSRWEHESFDDVPIGSVGPSYTLQKDGELHAEQQKS